MPEFRIAWYDDEVQLSHIYKMAQYFFDLNRGYEVVLAKWIEFDGHKELIQGKASHNDPQEATRLAQINLADKIAGAPEAHAKHIANVSKLAASRPPEPPKVSVATLTLDDLDL